MLYGYHTIEESVCEETQSGKIKVEESARSRPSAVKFEFQEKKEDVKVQTKKYTVKPPKDLTSKYDAYMHQRHLDKIQADKDRLQEEENKRIAVS